VFVIAVGYRENMVNMMKTKERKCSLCGQAGHQRNQCKNSPFGGGYEHPFDRKPRVLFSRVQGNQTRDTHTDKSYARLFKKYGSGNLIENGRTIDPFARNCEWAYPFTNDINPETRAEFHEEALDFITRMNLPDGFQLGLLDPPFSDRQAKDKYGSSNLYASDARKIKQISQALGNVIELGGFIIKAGYNSNSFHAGFELVEIVMVHYNGSIQDTIFSVWEKVSSLGSISTNQEWCECDLDITPCRCGE